MYFSSLSEYLVDIGSGFALRSLLGCRFVGICSRRLDLFSSTYLVDARMLIVIWLGACKLDIWPSSAPGMC
jgi:hypothetical protein